MAFTRVTGENLASQSTTPLLGLGGGEGHSAGWGGAEPEPAVHPCNLCACTSQTRMFEHKAFYVLSDGFYSFVLQAEAVNSSQEDY